MRIANLPIQCGLPIFATLCVLTLTPGVTHGVDYDSLKKAKEALQQRTQARLDAGWKPKSKDEQLLTRLRLSKRRWELKKMRYAQRAEFEQAKADVYLELSKHYASITYTYYGYQTSLVEDPETGMLIPITSRRRYSLVDPLAAAIAAHWGEKAARSSGIAAAQKYRANTYYANQVQNAEMRIQALKASIAAEGPLAGLP